MDDQYGEWGRKDGTLSDKSARETYGLTHGEIVSAIRAGKLQYREGSMHGNPWLRLLRREVEALVIAIHGKDYLKERAAKKELAGINSDLRRLKKEIAQLEVRKAKLTADLSL